MILAIDCGSTNHKVALFDECLRRLSGCSALVTYTIRDAERVEFDPERIWQDTLSLIVRTCAAARVQPQDITTIALTSQAQTFTLVDAHGKAIVPFLSWADQRAQEESVELKARLGGQFHQHCSFPAPIPQLQVSKLLWLARRLPALHRPGVSVASLPAFLALRLGGVRCADSNLAAMSGLYSLARKTWWSEALSACCLVEENLGAVVEPGTDIPVRTRCAELELSPELRLVFAGNDQTAGAYANRIAAETLVVTLGTALVAYRFVGLAPGPFQPDGCWGSFPGGGFYELLTRDEGCAALDWAVAQIRPGNETGFMQLAASASCGRALFYPRRIRQRDAWTGSDDPASRARAVLEGICFSLRELVEALAPPSAARQTVIAIGGGSASLFWLQMLADVLNRPVRRGRGDIPLGAAMLARPGIEPADDVEVVWFIPDLKQVADYAQLYHQWQQRAPTMTKS